jgi:16S rRNA processing protein RimM
VDVVVGRIGKAHGIRGEVGVDVRTDFADQRFAVGATLRTEPDRGVLTVAKARPHSGRLLVAFDGIDDRTAAEALRGTLLLVDATSDPALDVEDEWYDHQLEGLAAELADGTRVGVVTEVVHVPGNDLLAVRRDDGREVLVPFVAAIVPVVDLPAGRVVIDPPPGLLDLDAAE